MSGKISVSAAVLLEGLIGSGLRSGIKCDDSITYLRSCGTGSTRLDRLFGFLASDGGGRCAGASAARGEEGAARRRPEPSEGQW